MRGAMPLEPAGHPGAPGAVMEKSSSPDLLVLHEHQLKAHQDSNYPDSIATALKGVDLAHRLGRKAEEADFLQRAGYDYWLMGDFPEAIELSQQLVKLADELNDDRFRSLGYRTLGATYNGLRNAELSNHFNELALQCAIRAGDDRLKYAALNNLGNNLSEAGEFAKARSMHEEVLAYRMKTNDLWGAAGSITNLADVAFAEKDYTKSLALQQQALDMRVKDDDHRGQVRSLRQVAEALMKLNRPDDALLRLLEAKRRGEEIGGHQLLRDVYRDLADCYEAKGDLKQAIEYVRLTDREQSAMSGELVLLRVAELQTRYDLAKKDALIENLAKERKVQESELRARQAELSAGKAQKYGLGASLILAGLAVAALIAKLRAERLALIRAKDAQEAAENIARLKSRIIGIVSHDVRSPLKTISHLAEDLKEELTAKGIPAEPCDWISVESDRVAGFLDDLLSSEMLDTGKLELRRVAVDLGRVAREVVARQRWNADAKKQRLIFIEPVPGLPTVFGDYARLYQVVVNLISNAIKYTPINKTIMVSVEPNGKFMTLHVQDEGPGIAERDFPRLFNAYTRLANAPTGGESSHGLGLSIAREIIELHGGTITVESSLGRGSTFIVSLPV